MGMFEGIKKFFQPDDESNNSSSDDESQERNITVDTLLKKEIEQENNEGGVTMATAKEMEKILAQVVKDNGLEGAVIADLEGLPLASYLPADLNEDEIAAAAAAILTVGDSKLSEAGKGKVVQASIEAEDGYMVISPMKEEYVVSVIAPKEAKLGIILSAIRTIEKKLQ